MDWSYSIPSKEENPATSRISSSVDKIHGEGPSFAPFCDTIITVYVTVLLAFETYLLTGISYRYILFIWTMCAVDKVSHYKGPEPKMQASG